MTLHEFIQSALAEDVGDGDHTSLSTIPADAQKRARLLVKEAGILAGVNVAEAIFAEVDPAFQVDVFLQDGVAIKPGDIVLTVSGNARNILTAERLVLNCMQRMSGIATQTRQMVNMLEGTRCKLLDTRKTTPNFRLCEKMAVKIGGGVNHRFGLYDMILIKDNHVDYAGSLTKAVTQAVQYLADTGRNLPIEVEVRNRAEVEEALAVGHLTRMLARQFSARRPPRHGAPHQRPRHHRSLRRHQSRQPPCLRRNRCRLHLIGRVDAPREEPGFEFEGLLMNNV